MRVVTQRYAIIERSEIDKSSVEGPTVVASHFGTQVVLNIRRRVAATIMEGSTCVIGNYIAANLVFLLWIASKTRHQVKIAAVKRCALRRLLQTQIKSVPGSRIFEWLSRVKPQQACVVILSPNLSRHEID